MRNEVTVPERGKGRQRKHRGILLHFGVSGGPPCLREAAEEMRHHPAFLRSRIDGLIEYPAGIGALRESWLYPSQPRRRLNGVPA
jgi:hypothetical protein